MAEAIRHSKGTTGVTFSLSVEDLDSNPDMPVDFDNFREHKLRFRRPDGVIVVKPARLVSGTNGAADTIDWTIPASDTTFLTQTGVWLVWAEWSDGADNIYQSFDRSIFYVV